MAKSMAPKDYNEHQTQCYCNYPKEVKTPFIADIEKDLDISCSKYTILLVAIFIKVLPNSCDGKFDNQCIVLFVPHFSR